MQTREREVKGLVEALQVTPPRPCSADYLGVYSTTTLYPSLAALKCLSAGAISECIWALAVLGGGAVYESETDMLIQVNNPGRSCTQLVAYHLLWVTHRTITCPAAAVVLCQHVPAECCIDHCLVMLYVLCPCMFECTEAATEKHCRHLLQNTRCSRPSSLSCCMTEHMC